MDITDLEYLHVTGEATRNMPIQLREWTVIRLGMDCLNIIDNFSNIMTIFINLLSLLNQWIEKFLSGCSREIKGVDILSPFFEMLLVINIIKIPESKIYRGNLTRQKEKERKTFHKLWSLARDLGKEILERASKKEKEKENGLFNWESWDCLIGRVGSC